MTGSKSEEGLKIIDEGDFLRGETVSCCDGFTQNDDHDDIITETEEEKEILSEDDNHNEIHAEADGMKGDASVGRRDCAESEMVTIRVLAVCNVVLSLITLIVFILFFKWERGVSYLYTPLFYQNFSK